MGDVVGSANNLSMLILLPWGSKMWFALYCHGRFEWMESWKSFSVVRCCMKSLGRFCTISSEVIATWVLVSFATLRLLTLGMKAGMVGNFGSKICSPPTLGTCPLFLSGGIIGWNDSNVEFLFGEVRSLWTFANACRISSFLGNWSNVFWSISNKCVIFWSIRHIFSWKDSMGKRIFEAKI